MEVIGAYTGTTAGENDGAVYVVVEPVTGTINLSEADVKYVGENAWDLAGSSVATGDVDGDGTQDLLVGAYGESSGGYDAGAVYLLYSGGL